MANKFCPYWIFNICVARTAYDFIVSDLPIKAYAKKYSLGLSKQYFEIKPEEIEDEAENLLRFLVEMNTDESDQLINSYIYFCLKYVQNGSKRKLKGLFGSAFDATKEKTYQEKITLKSFRAYVYGLRSGVSYKPSSGWDILDEEGLEFLKELIEKEAKISDAL